MRPGLSRLLLVASLLAGVLACQGNGKDDPIGDYPHAGDDFTPISDFPRQGHSEEEEHDFDAGAVDDPSEAPAPHDEGHATPEPATRPHAPAPAPGASNDLPPFGVGGLVASPDGGVAADGAVVEIAQPAADAGETAAAPDSADAGVAAP